MVGGHAAAPGRDDPARRIHGVHRGEHRREGAGRHRSEDGGTQEHGLGLLRQHDPASRDVGVLAEKDWIPGAAAAGQYRVDLVTATVHLLDDMARAVGHRLDRGEILAGEIVGRGRQGEAGDRAAQRGVGARRAVAMEIRLEVQPMGELGRVRDPLRLRKQF